MVKSFSLKNYRFVHRYEHLRQIIVYLMIGGSSAVLDLILLFVLVDLLDVWYLLAGAVAFITVATIGFFLHRRFTFKFTGGRTKIRYMIFLFVAGSGLLWELTFLFIFVDIFKLWYLHAAIITKFIVLSWNFLMNKYVTFGSIKQISRLNPRLES